MPDQDGWRQRCDTCGGLGIVCPTCRGLRWVRLGGYSPANTLAGEDRSRSQPCPGCCIEATPDGDGNATRWEYSAEREAETIRQAYDASRDHVPL